jgi:glycosyltransferase involved in cell wall biosynthesis
LDTPMSNLVSILIPAYNKENFIGETISSALNQTWPNKEVIVVDDGSTDRTLEVARSFQSTDLKVVTQANTGACGARNAALSLAQGDYIQWLDADDLLHPEKVFRQLSSGEVGRDSLTLITGAWGRFFFRHQKARFVEDSLWQDLDPVDWIVNKFSDNVWMNPTVWLVSRRLSDLAGPWDERLTTSGDDDGEYICRVVAASNGVRFVREAKSYYRIGIPGSLNWGMATSQTKLDALFLSLQLSIRHLMDLENSERTKSASMKYIEIFSHYFYGCDEEFIHQVGDFASRLGGHVDMPKTSWKYAPLEKFLGRHATFKIQQNWRGAKMLVSGKIDKLLYDMAK